MSNLLSQASLVMIPSGYKEDVVYSPIPTNGNGDLSFTRASNGTRINSAGLVEVTPWNLVTDSERIDVSPWAVYGTGTVTANATTAPNGTLTADRFVPSVANTSHVFEQSMGTTNGIITMSIYAKADGYDYICFNSYVGAFNYTWFNISNGTIGTVASGVTASIESVGNGWYRCIVSILGGATTYFSIITATANGITSFAGNGTSGIFVWGCQLNIGSTAKPYFPTTDRLNVPRLTYQNGGGGCPSLLLEKQSTNVLTYSEQFDNAGWTLGDSTVSANTTTSPDGTQNADKLIESATNAAHYIYQVSAITASVLTTSVFIKKSELRYAVVFISNTVNKNFAVLFDLQLGVVVTNFTSISSYSAPTSSSIQDFGNGWYRCIVTATDTFTNASCVVCLNKSGADSGFSYMGDGTSGLYIYGAQLEASSYPTSYIPTTSASATRVADACSKTGISSLIGQTEGVWFLDFTYVYNDATYQSFILDNGTGSNVIYMYRSSTNTLNFYVKAISIGTYTISNNTRYKIAFAYKSGQHAIYINGASVLTSVNSDTTSALNSLRCSYTDGSEQLQCPIHQIVLFPTRLTNTELASLTTI